MVSNEVLPRYVLSLVLCAYLLWSYSDVALDVFACLAFQPREVRRHFLGRRNSPPLLFKLRDVICPNYLVESWTFHTGTVYAA
jgi:hypothetical protein